MSETSSFGVCLKVSQKNCLYFILLCHSEILPKNPDTSLHRIRLGFFVKINGQFTLIIDDRQKMVESLSVIKKGTLTHYLLLALGKGIESGIPLLDFLASPSTFVWTDYRTNLNYSNLYKTVRQLRIKGYIDTAKDGRKILLKLTDKGKQELILKKLLENKSWDGKWQIVIFDIPEKHRKIRNSLRSKLREWQFKQLQKSVWVGKKDVSSEIKKFIDYLAISQWVQIFVANKI